MLSLMAGIAAEKHFLGEESVCGSGDMAAMHSTAVIYLMAGYGEAYCHDTKNDAEIAANRRAIERLRESFKVKAARLIELNEDQCRSLAALIDEREYLGCEDIHKIVSAATLPDGIGRLTWPRSIPLFAGDGAPA